MPFEKHINALQHGRCSQMTVRKAPHKTRPTTPLFSVKSYPGIKIRRNAFLFKSLSLLRFS